MLSAEASARCGGACQVMNLGRTTSLYKARKATGKAQRLQQLIVELSLKYLRYGYRRITILLRHRGWTVSFKKVQRIRRQEGLGVKPEPTKRKRRGTTSAIKQRAEEVNEV